jgi:hypothetical protein
MAITTYDRNRLKIDVLEKALALQTDDTDANRLALGKALNAYEEGTNDVGSAVARALLGRKAPVNLLASDAAAKSSDDPDQGTVGERIRLRNDGRTEHPKVELNTAANALKKKPPRVNAPLLYKDEG